MVENGFISEVKNYNRISLGSAERLFLILYCLNDNFSASKLHAYLKNTEKPMAYKNVHKRVKRLQDLNLIEEVKEKRGRWRNEIKYKVTPFGLFQRLLLVEVPVSRAAILRRNKDSLILQTILYRYFEPKSIAKFESYALRIIANYLKKCCEVILEWMENYRTKYKRATPSSITENMDNLITHEAKGLILNIVTISNLDELFFPIETLTNDKKFMEILQEMKKDFDNGYQKFEHVL
jgi:hypothetical protein